MKRQFFLRRDVTRGILLLCVGINVVILFGGGIANGQNYDSLLAFRLVQPPDSFFVNHRPLWFIRTKPPLANIQTVSHEFRLWNPAGGLRQLAHQGFDTATFFRPAMFEEGIYRWDYAVHPGELVIDPNPNARWSLNGPRFLIYDITPPIIAQAHLTHGLDFNSPSQITLHVEASEMIDTSLSKAEIVFQNDTLRGTFQLTAPGMFTYSSSFDLLPFRTDGLLPVFAASYNVDRATNSSDTIRYSGVLTWLEQPSDIEISDATGVLYLRLFRPTTPHGTAVLVLTLLDKSVLASQSPPPGDPHKESIPEGTIVLRPHESKIETPTVSQQSDQRQVVRHTQFIDASSEFTVLPEAFGSEDRHFLSITYDTALVKSNVIAAGIPADNYDERNIGIYRYEYNVRQWFFVGGEGSEGKVEFWPTKFGTLKAAYNPQHELYPTQTQLLQNYPNPFNASTNIRFEIKEINHVEIHIYDALGRRITTLVNEVKEPGTHSVIWNAARISSGVYFCRLKSGNFFDTKKLLLLK